MSIVNVLIDFIFNLDHHLNQIIQLFGVFSYIIVFLVVFIETGLVFFPFLPGDSLLFATGTIAALGSLNIYILLIGLSLAAIIGDTVNYSIGRFFGEAIVSNPRIPINQTHLDKTNKFFQKHGGKTIILARFVPIVRTFAPFVAGAGQMQYRKFIIYNVLGGISWVLIGTLSGYFFGNIPLVKDNFSLVVILIVIISVLPMVLEYFKYRLLKK